MGGYGAHGYKADALGEAEADQFSARLAPPSAQ
jgi:hypothetical protein